MKRRIGTSRAFVVAIGGKVLRRRDGGLAIPEPIPQCTEGLWKATCGMPAQALISVRNQ
jgi:hypothetical protein